MKIMREFTVKREGIVATRGIVCRFTLPPAEPVRVQHVLPSVRGWNGFDARPIIAAARPDTWETAGYVALWACGLLSIGLCLV